VLTGGAGIAVPTVGDKGARPSSMPVPGVPDVPFTLETLTLIAPYALAFALVGLMESLMTAKLMDDINDTHSNKTRESMLIGPITGRRRRAVSGAVRVRGKRCGCERWCGRGPFRGDGPGSPVLVGGDGSALPPHARIVPRSGGRSGGERARRARGALFSAWLSPRCQAGAGTAGLVDAVADPRVYRVSEMSGSGRRGALSARHGRPFHEGREPTAFADSPRKGTDPDDQKEACR